MTNISRDSYLPLTDDASAETGEVSRLSCLEVRGGNRAAVYEAQLPGLDAWISCRPLLPATRGGDLYYLSVCSHGAISRVTLADVSGHGDDVSTLAERLRDSLREHVDHWDQSALIRQLNHSFLKISTHGRFATAVLLGHYAETGELVFTNAGHPPPLWFHAAAREWALLQEETLYSKEIADLPLGIISGTAYSQSAIQLAPGDVLLLYTDGIMESPGDDGQKLGLAGLLEMARGLPAGSAAEAGAALLESVKRFRGAAQAKDDETVVVLQARPHSEVQR